MHILLDMMQIMLFGLIPSQDGFMSTCLLLKTNISDKLNLTMMYTKKNDKYKYCLLLKVGSTLGGDHIIIKTKVKSHSAPGTLLPQTNTMLYKKGNQFIQNS